MTIFYKAWEGFAKKKLLFFKILSKLPPPPPPSPQFGQLVQPFSAAEIQDLKVSLGLNSIYTLYYSTRCLKK